jgi:hypothetical protein
VIYAAQASSYTMDGFFVKYREVLLNSNAKYRALSINTGNSYHLSMLLPRQYVIFVKFQALFKMFCKTSKYRKRLVGFHTKPMMARLKIDSSTGNIQVYSSIALCSLSFARF